jgi:hypothetical protein
MSKRYLTESDIKWGTLEKLDTVLYHIIHSLYGKEYQKANGFHVIETSDKIYANMHDGDKDFILEFLNHNEDD